jgi:hypothetical protein
MTGIKILWEPNAGPQTAFLMSEAREVLYGGAAGGGKTDALMLLPADPSAVARSHRPTAAAVPADRARGEVARGQEPLDLALWRYYVNGFHGT